MKNCRIYQLIIVFIILGMNLLVAQENFSFDPNFSRCKTDTTIFMTVDSMPEFTAFSGKNSQERIDNFITSNFQFPTDDDCFGRVIVRVVVEPDGSLTNYHIVYGAGLCRGFDEEVIRVIKLMPKWKPGKLNNKPVRVYSNIIFKIKMI